MLDSSDIRCPVLSFRWWFMELFFVCADLLRWVPIFLHTVYSAQFCLHRCRSSPMLSYVFKMLSVDWYVRNRIKYVHPVSDGNSRCRLGAARHSTTSRVLPAQSASRVTVRHGMNVPDSLYQDRFDSDDGYLVQRICDMDEDAGINDICPQDISMETTDNIINSNIRLTRYYRIHPSTFS